MKFNKMVGDAERFDVVFQSKVIQLPNVKITSNYLYNENDILLQENEHTTPFDRQTGIVITFLLSGNITSVYEGIDQKFENKSKTTSFVYGPKDNQHFMARGQVLDNMAVGISKTFFQSLLHEEDIWLERMLNDIEKGKPFSPTSEPYPITPAVLHMLQQIRNTNLTGSLKSLLIQSRITEILMLHFERFKANAVCSSRQNVRNSDVEKLWALRTFLENHFCEDLSLDQLAAEHALNTFKIKTGFKQLFNQSVFEYVRSLRMQYAQKMLSDSDVSVGEVSDMVGYQHIQHFSHAFKKHFGESPKGFKRSNDLFGLNAAP